MTGYQNVPDSILAKNAERIKLLKDFVRVRMVERQYHNFSHALDAAERFSEYGNAEGLIPMQIFLGVSAMTAHDLVCVPGRNDNEERSIDELGGILGVIGYDSKEREEIFRMIESTKIGVEPRSLLEKIAKDADTDNLGREDFFLKNEDLRQELDVRDPIKWYQSSLNFLRAHRYYTTSAIIQRESKKQEHIDQLNDLVQAALDIAPMKSYELVK